MVPLLNDKIIIMIIVIIISYKKKNNWKGMVDWPGFVSDCSWMI